MESPEFAFESAAFNAATHEARTSRRGRFRAWLERSALALCVAFSIAPFALYLLAVRLESFVFDVTVEKASTIAPGASHEQVERVLGKPLTQFAVGDKLFWIVTEHETWVYGRVLTYNAFHAEPPFFYPFVFRFCPSTEDLAILFDASGSVSEIRFPTDRRL